MLQVCFVLYST